MKLNNLPEDYDAERLGPQKRQTEFESEEAKLTYDAQGLIKKARQQFEKTGIKVDPIVFAQRNDDNIEALKAAIAKEHQDVNQATTTPAESKKHEVTPERVEQVIKMLKGRYDMEENRNLCPRLDWNRAEKALRATPEALWTVDAADKNGHEPAIYFSDETGFDIGTLAKKAPQSTRNCVYDAKAEALRRKNYPDDVFNGNAEAQAKAIGVDLQTIEQGKHIVKNTPAYIEQGWRWYKTPTNVRDTGPAISGARFGYTLAADQYDAGNHGGRGGWGGSLRVNFVD